MDEPTTPTVATFQSKAWGVVFFVTGGLGFFYEVGFGHDKVWGVLCALWAAGGPAFVADRSLRGWLK